LILFVTTYFLGTFAVVIRQGRITLWCFRIPHLLIQVYSIKKRLSTSFNIPSFASKRKWKMVPSSEHLPYSTATPPFSFPPVFMSTLILHGGMRR